jgi:hypothetical protein
MPEAQEILAGLYAIANDYTLFAILWHVVFYIFIIALVARLVPSSRFFGTIICIPLFSVAVFAWITGNPFNGTLFSIIAILTLVFGLKAVQEPVSFSQLPNKTIGVMMIVFGLVYPHFIETGSFFKYLYASPVGLIPCPTLSILIGFILLFNGVVSKATTLTFIVFGLFYGFFGVLKLGVYLDLFLILGTLTLLAKNRLTILK